MPDTEDKVEKAVLKSARALCHQVCPAFSSFCLLYSFVAVYSWMLVPACTSFYLFSQRPLLMLSLLAAT